MWRSVCFGLTLSVLFVCLGVTDSQAGSLDAGEAPYERCALCHGLYGDSTRSKFPKLAGLPANYLEVQIRQFINGDRSNDGGQMASIVTELAENEIDIVASWFSSQVVPQPIETTIQYQRGEALYTELKCTGCHDEQAAGFYSGVVPPLSSQHVNYLSKQMREIRDGERSGRSGGKVCAQSSSTLSDKDIEQVAEYLAAQQRVAPE